ncbi:hypothetical protein BLX06_32410 [Bacillus cereus]|uniref:Transposase n=1 Tax=Bacillus cereus TaxID=1396 RepID=A0A9X6GCM1_BACCE|nr:hypothetical protein BLX06_32410 [Bacillus cereus]
MEALSTGYHCINCTLVPTAQSKFSRPGGNEERGLSLAHTTIMRWVHQYGPELDKRIRRHLKQMIHIEQMNHI